MQIVPKNPTQLFISDYQYTLLHMAWYRNDDYRALLFGMIELLPKEFPQPARSPEISMRIGTEGRRYIYACRYVMAAEKALEWYEKCREGNILLPEDGWDASSVAKKRLEFSQLSEEPAWSQLNSVSELPFVPDCHVSPRVHHLIPVALPDEIKELKCDGPVLKWLSENLYFDFKDYPEYFGSLNLVAPNPVIRAFNNRLAPNNDNGNEAELFQFMPRSGFSLDGLKLLICEQRPTGIASIRSIPIESDILRVEYVGEVEKVGVAIVCPERGVLYWHKPYNFVKSINLNLKLITGKKVVSVPPTNKRCSQTYEVPLSGDDTIDMVGSISNELNGARILYREQSKREDRREGERLGQRWFHGDQREAEDFVRNLVISARKRVVIVDPYFSTRELFNFALAASSPQVKVCVLTSAEVLRERDEIISDVEAGEVLLKEIEANKDKAKVMIHVMPGEKPEIHDRFLIIDDEVWLSGNSLNEIGKRAGVIVKLPYPDPIINNIEAFLKKHLDLKTWVEERRKNKAEIKPLEKSGL